MMQVSRQVPRLVVGADGQGPRTLPEEVAVALTFNGTTQAVMMATPSDLVDFAYGFAMTEGIAQPGEIESVTVVTAPNGIDIQVWLQPQAEARLAKRRRTMAGPVGWRIRCPTSLSSALCRPTSSRAACKPPVQKPAA